MKLTHLDENGAAHMVNIGAKPVTQREAVAQSVLTMQPETLRMILDGTAPKGDVFACAAKRTAELIPMCHPIPIESVDIAIEAVSETQVRVVSTLRCSHKTGIEMEALTAASVAALTVYDMCKAVDRGMRIDETLLLHKTGGKSGDYHAEGASAR
jgi:cyclic pyranopterin phosphate synthase